MILTETYKKYFYSLLTRTIVGDILNAKGFSELKSKNLLNPVLFIIHQRETCSELKAFSKVIKVALIMPGELAIYIERDKDFISRFNYLDLIS